jgi:hypothetical protein
VLQIFIALKKSIALAGFGPATFGSSGKHNNHYTTKVAKMLGWFLKLVHDCFFLHLFQFIIYFKTFVICVLFVWLTQEYC